MIKPKSSNVYLGFEEIKSENIYEWEASLSLEYKEYRRKWKQYPKKLIVPRFPLHLDIEATSNCDLRCPMCARTVRLKQSKWRPIQNLSLELLKKIIDEGSKEGLCAINLNNFGEPLLNPNLSKMIMYAKEKGILDIFFHTNAVTLNEKKARALIESGLDRLIISFDSPYPEKYEKIRVGAKFENVLNNIKMFSELKKELNKVKPTTRINFIKFPNVSKKEIEDLIKLMSPLVDSIGFLDYIDPHKETEKEFSKDYVSKFICPQIITRLNIWEDGKVFPCCMDYDGELCLGNLNKITLKQAWESEKMKAIRKKHFEGKFFLIPACRKCEFALKGDLQKKEEVLEGQKVTNFKIKTPKGERTIGLGHPVFIVAEMSANHNQKYDQALKIIDAASEAGADAIKLQTYTPDTMTIDCDKDYFQVKVNNAWKGKTLYELYETAYTPWEWQPKLKEYAESKGLIFFSTPFDKTAVDFLEKMNVQLYKVASFEVGDIPLLKKIAQTKKPVIMSRGLSTLEEIELAVKTLKENGCPHVIILHCVSSYPANPEQMNLRTIPDLAQRTGIITGLSDHTLGTTVSLTSVALGASIIEKHFTLSRADGGPDAAFSLESEEMKELVKSVREAEKALGQPAYKIGKKESENIIFKRSIFAVKDIKQGEKLTEENVRVIRPGHGLAPKYFEEILGKTVSQDIKRGTPLRWDLLR